MKLTTTAGSILKTYRRHHAQKRYTQRLRHLRKTEGRSMRSTCATSAALESRRAADAETRAAVLQSRLETLREQAQELRAIHTAYMATERAHFAASACCNAVEAESLRRDMVRQLAHLTVYADRLCTALGVPPVAMKDGAR